MAHTAEPTTPEPEPISWWQRTFSFQPAAPPLSPPTVAVVAEAAVAAAQAPTSVEPAVSKPGDALENSSHTVSDLPTENTEQESSSDESTMEMEQDAESVTLSLRGKQWALRRNGCSVVVLRAVKDAELAVISATEFGSVAEAQQFVTFQAHAKQQKGYVQQEARDGQGQPTATPLRELPSPMAQRTAEGTDTTPSRAALQQREEDERAQARRHEFLHEARGSLSGGSFYSPVDSAKGIAERDEAVSYAPSDRSTTSMESAPSGYMCICVSQAAVTREFEFDPVLPDVVGFLAPGDKMYVYEERQVHGSIRTRARLRDGWVSTSAEDGTVLLQSIEREQQITSVAQSLHDERAARLAVELQLEEEREVRARVEGELAEALLTLEAERRATREAAAANVARERHGADHAHNRLREWLQEQRLGHAFDAFVRVLGAGGAPEDIPYLEDEDIAELQLMRLEERRLRSAMKKMGLAEEEDVFAVLPLSPAPRAVMDVTTMTATVSESELDLSPDTQPSSCASSPSPPTPASPLVPKETLGQQRRKSAATIQRFARGRQLRHELREVQTEDKRRELRRQRSRSFLNEEQVQSQNDRELLQRGSVFVASPRDNRAADAASITKVQAMWRGRSLRQKIAAATALAMAEYHERTEAVTRIQAVFRGGLARKAVMELMAQEEHKLMGQLELKVDHAPGAARRSPRAGKGDQSPRRRVVVRPRDVINNVEQLDDRDVRKMAVKRLSRVFSRAKPTAFNRDITSCA